MDNNIIVLETASNLRARGRAALAGNWQGAVIASGIFMIFMDLIPGLIRSLLGWNIATGYSDINFTGSPAPLYTLLMTGPLMLGIAVFFIELFRHQSTEINGIFAGFENFGKSFVLGFVMMVFIFLWSLLLIVPGIIAYFRYSQAFYIMKDNPDLSAMDCLRESKRIMQGNKGKLFVMTISFIGWAILAAIPASVYTTIFVGNNGDPGFFDTMMIFIFGAGSFWLTAYYYSTSVAFYELLKGNISGQVFISGQN